MCAAVEVEPSGVSTGSVLHSGTSKWKHAYGNATKSAKLSSSGNNEIPKHGSESETFEERTDKDAEEGMDPEERNALLRWQRRQEFARWIAAERLAKADADEDPPPDPAEERLLDRLSAAVVEEEPPIDFGHDLHLSVEEREYMDSRVKEELAKIPRVSQASPSLEGLLFAEMFDKPDVFSSWVISRSYTHQGGRRTYLGLEAMQIRCPLYELICSA